MVSNERLFKSFQTQALLDFFRYQNQKLWSDKCRDKRHEIFTHGGAKHAAQNLGLPFLGEIPIEIGVRQGSDEGKPIALNDEGKAAAAFKELAYEVASRLAVAALNESKGPSISVSGKRGLPVIAT